MKREKLIFDLFYDISELIGLYKRMKKEGENMGKIIISRKNDKEINLTDLFGCILLGLMAGFFCIPFGAVLSGVMQNILGDYSDEVRYKYFFLPIILFIIIAEVFLSAMKIWDNIYREGILHIEKD